MNDLRSLYQRHHDTIIRVREQFPDEELYGPLLAYPTTYFDQPRRLLVIGQETNGWACNYRDLDFQLAYYRDFNVAENYRVSPFWQFVRKIESIMSIVPCSCAWTNLNRFDQDHAPPKGEVLAQITTLDFLVREEITALLPDVCVFFTHKRHDDRLTALYDGLTFENLPGLPADDFVRLRHPALPANTFRTPHPKSIRLRGLEDSFMRVVRKQVASRPT